MKELFTWLKAKTGRFVTGIGIILGGVETLDISAIKDPLENLIGHKGVQAVTVGLFIASFARHQFVANQHPVPKPVDDGK